MTCTSTGCGSRPMHIVTSVFVVDERVSGGGGVIYYPPTVAWHGFGLYEFSP